MTLTAAKSGGWALQDLLTSTQVTHLQTELLKAVDGAAGGTYSLSAPLIFTGDDVRLDSDDIDIVAGGELTVLGTANLVIESTAELLVEAGGLLTIDGDAAVGSGGLVTVEDGGAVLFELGSDLTIENGATFLLEQGATGALQLGAGTTTSLLSTATLDVKSTATFLIGEQETIQIDVPSVRTGYVPLEDGVATQAGSSATVGWVMSGLRWVNSDTSIAKQLSMPIRLSPGDVLESVTVRVAGGTHSDIPEFPPQVFVDDITQSTGTSSALGSTTDAPASQAAYDAAHDITVGSLSHTIVSGHRIKIRIIGESGTDSFDDQLDVLSVSVTYRRNRMRQTQEVL
jgi:hypothetical protein